MYGLAMVSDVGKNRIFSFWSARDVLDPELCWAAGRGRTAGWSRFSVVILWTQRQETMCRGNTVVCSVQQTELLAWSGAKLKSSLVEVVFFVGSLWFGTYTKLVWLVQAFSASTPTLIVNIHGLLYKLCRSILLARNTFLVLNFNIREIIVKWQQKLVEQL